MSDLFNVFSKQNWCRFILAILFSWAFTYTGGMADGVSTGMWGAFQRICKEQLSIADSKTVFFMLIALVYFLVYPVLDKFLNIKDTICPMLEGTNPLESSEDSMENEEEN